jgi:hypothetical protein
VESKSDNEKGKKGKKESKKERKKQKKSKKKKKKKRERERERGELEIEPCEYICKFAYDATRDGQNNANSLQLLRTQPFARRFPMPLA